MRDEQAVMAGAEAQQIFLNDQVGLFLFDLKNEASEHGFKPTEHWALQLVTEVEKIGLKKLHHPLITLRLQPNALLKVYQQVKNRLQQPLSNDDIALTATDLTRDEKTYLAAYPADTNHK